MSKISVVHYASGDLWAGAENCVFQLIREQVHNPSLQVSAIILNAGQLAKQIQALGVDVHLIDESANNTIKILIRSLFLLRKKSPAVVHTHRRKENIVGSICTLFTPGLLSVRTVHGGQEIAARRFSISRIVDFIDYLCAKWIQKSIIYVSDELRQREMQRLTVGHAAVVENGIDVEQFRRTSSTPARSSTKLECQIYLYAGRLTAVKRIDLILQAATELSRSESDIRFHIAGSGPMESDIRTYVNAHRLEETVSVLGFRPDISNLIRASDALLITSDHEGLPLVALEAMALETIVVYRPVGALDEVFQHGECGIRWDPEENCLASVLSEITTMKKELTQKTALALNRVRKHYSISRTETLYHEIYRLLL